jgi:hypothetical protein
MSKEKTVRVRRTFTLQFKKDALGLVSSGRGVTEVARDSESGEYRRAFPRRC